MSQPLENFSHRSYVSLYNYFPTCSKMNSRPHIFPLFEYQSGNDSIYLPIKAMITARPLYWKDFSRLLNNPRKRLVISRLARNYRISGCSRHNKAVMYGGGSLSLSLSFRAPGITEARWIGRRGVASLLLSWIGGGKQEIRDYRG